VPAGFDHVADIRQISNGIRLFSKSHKHADCDLHLEILKSRQFD
jgi:hypothetical protein